MRLGRGGNLAPFFHAFGGGKAESESPKTDSSVILDRLAGIEILVNSKLITSIGPLNSNEKDRRIWVGARDGLNSGDEQ